MDLYRILQVYFNRIDLYRILQIIIIFVNRAYTYAIARGVFPLSNALAMRESVNTVNRKVC